MPKRRDVEKRGEMSVEIDIPNHATQTDNENK